MNQRRAFAILGLAVAVATIVPILVWGTLPDRLAVNWSIGGEPTNLASPPVAWLATSGVSLLLASLTWLAVIAGRRSRNLTTYAGLGIFLSVTMAGATALVMLANAGSQPPPRVSPLLVLPILVIAAVAVLAVNPRLIPGVGRFNLAPPAAEPALWRGTAESTFAFPTTMVFVLAGVAVGIQLQPALGLLLVVAGLLVLSLVAIEVEVTTERVRVRYFGGARWPATELAMSAITDVEAIEVRPMKHGGWGYRGTLRLMGWAAVNLRRGPGLRFTLTGDRTFLVTVDDAALGASAIRDVLNRRSPERKAS